MNGSLVVPALVALPAACAVLLLPGFAILGAQRIILKGAARRAGGEQDAPQRGTALDPRAAGIVLAIAGSLCFAAVTGGTLLAFGVFTTTRLALITGFAAVIGLLPFLQWCRRAWRAVLAHTLLVLAVAAPISLSVFGGGFRPAQSYQWFYWTLGRQLSQARGIPGHVLEFGRAVRWQPDYLDYNLLSQAYLGLMPGVSDPVAVAVWRLPLALIVLGMTYLGFRLWFSFLPSAIAATALSATDFYIDKIGNNSPEALGIAFGFVSLWLAVQAVRMRRVSWLLLSAATGGLTLSVHGIAATVFALLIAAALVVELVAARPRASWWLSALAGGAVTSSVVVIALGVSLQGRASPLGDARNPTRVGGADPTYQFLQYSNGHFGTPVNHNSLIGLITTPWTGVDVMSFEWSWLLVLSAVGLIGAFWRWSRPAGRGVVISLVFAMLLGTAVAWFQLRYDTYVPQHTGNARIAAYLPLAYAFVIAAGVEVLVGQIARWPAARLRPRQTGVVGVVLAVVAIGVCAPLTITTMAGRPGISSSGVLALHELAARAPADSVVVSNVATRGTVEYFTGLEDPLEGRQPLIEDVSTLTSATGYLRRMHEFLRYPRRGELRQSLGAEWLLLVDNPVELGNRLEYGTPVPHLARRAGLEIVWRGDGVWLLRGAGSRPVVSSVGAHQVLWPGFLIAVLVTFVIVAATHRLLRRVSRPSGSHRGSSRKRT